jgi:2-polyprenyl-6-methoxyphenol hydroxylase-like FAD-dependent oxidoreductase
MQQQHRSPPHNGVVLIAGAGPIGMTLALQLQRFGIPYRIIERNAGPSTATKALALHSRTLDIFSDLGIAQEAVATGHAIKYFRVQSRGKTILRYDFTLLDAAHPLLLSLPQPQTERLLMNRLGELGGCIEWQTELLEMRDEGSHVTATLKKPSGETESLKVSWLVGADGARSTVRKQLGLSFDGEHYQRHFMLADMDVRWNGWHDEGVFFLGEREGYVAVAPLDDQGRYRLFVEIPRELPPEDQRMPLTVESFQQLCDGRGQLMKLSNPSSETMAAFQHRRTNTQRVGRVFLVGDATHIGSPIGGQWMNLGISEAYNLAWKIAHVHAGSLPERVLDSYDSERHPIALEAEKTAHTLTRLLTLRSPWLVRLRDTVLPRISALPSVQARLPWMISGHRYHIRKTASVQHMLSARDRKPTSRRPRVRSAFPPPRAGELLPDVPLWTPQGARPQRLLELVRGQFMVLLFTGADARSEQTVLQAQLAHDTQTLYPALNTWLVLDTLAPLNGPVASIADPAWQLHDRLAMPAGGIILVRPDGYIAFMGKRAQDLTRFIEVNLGLTPGHAGAIPQDLPAEVLSAEVA